MTQLKGMIEAVSHDQVSGWIAAPDASLRGQTVLAFLDGKCIGDGRIEVFRQDLADAGLGDGFAGFCIGTSPVPARAQMGVTVRLDRSDFTLLRPGARVSAAAPEAEEKHFAHLEPASLQWMMSHGWLRQQDHDFLKFFRRLGVYERSLLAQVDEVKDRKLLDAATVARNSLELLSLSDVVVEKKQLRTMAELEALLAGLKGNPKAIHCAALWSADRARLLVREGSHLPADEPVIAPLVEYALGPDRLLLACARLQFDPDATLPPGGVLAFTGRAAA
jgi:hypothetical protein